MEWQLIDTIPDREPCLVWSKRYGVEMAIKTLYGVEVADLQCGGYIKVDYVTHWMPLPEPPNAPQT